MRMVGWLALFLLLGTALVGQTAGSSEKFHRDLVHWVRDLGRRPSLSEALKAIKRLREEERARLAAAKEEGLWRPVQGFS